MGQVLAALEPKAVWTIFEEICQIPRPSKKEEKIAAWVLEFAKKHNLESQKDSLGNIVLRKPATAGMENRKPVVIQGHLDMVCEKNKDVTFDFDKDAIQPWIDGDWVKARGTTLGADNGIGVAMGLALMAANDIPHPPLEVLCTLDEETGLTGAMKLGKDMLKAKVLINLDSEEDGAFTIGCAGGQNTSGVFKFDGDAVPGSTVAYEVAVKGLRGGHSGIEIHDGRGNAINLLTRLLWKMSRELGIRLASFDSGNAHNAIPREGHAIITVPSDKENEFLSLIGAYDKTYKAEYASKEPGVAVAAEKTDAPKRVMTADFQRRFLNAFYAMPHGVIRMNPDIEGLVQTSTNFAMVRTRENDIFVLTSQRSSVATEITDISTMVRAALELGGAEVKHEDGYPAWQPNVKSPILKTAREVFENVFGKEPVIEAIHAGLECGIVGEKYPGMDMLSFGPTLKEVHSPDEKIQVSTVKNCWNLLLEILKNVPKN